MLAIIAEPPQLQLLHSNSSPLSSSTSLISQILKRLERKNKHIYHVDILIFMLLLCFILCHIKRSQSQSQYIDSENIGVEKYQDSVLRKLVLFWWICLCLLYWFFLFKWKLNDSRKRLNDRFCYCEKNKTLEKRWNFSVHFLGKLNRNSKYLMSN